MKREPRKVMQVEADDCMRACLATYFGCDLQDVPKLQADDWVKVVRQWANARGFGYVNIQVPNEEVFRECFSDGMLIVEGISRRDVLHAVIYKDGQLWHDPHPDSTGIDCVLSVDYFYLLHPPGCEVETAEARA